MRTRILRRRITPLEALLAGSAAGTAGTLAQSLFFIVSAKIAPGLPSQAFSPPEDVQRHEMPTETVARRFLEGFMQRGPLEKKAKRRAATAVHLAFGTGWGALYGVARESFPELATPAGAAGFGLAVWNTSDNMLLPAFRLAALPHRYPLRNHLYAMLAHLVYGLSVGASYELLRRAPRLLQVAMVLRALPSFVRWPLVKRALAMSSRRVVRRSARRVRLGVQAIAS